MLEETPWVRDAAKDESQARRNVGILFDEQPAQRRDGPDSCASSPTCSWPDGAWPWFPGGPENDYITLYIATGFGRLRHLGVKVDVAPAVKALARLDAWVDEIYRHILEHGKTGRQPPVLDDRACTCTAAASSWATSRSAAAAPGGGRLLAGPGPHLLAEAGQPPVAGPPRAGAARGSADADDAEGDPRLDQGAVGVERGTRHVLARHRTVLVVVPRPDRDAGGDDRGVRRGGRRRRSRSRTARSGCSSRSRPRTGRRPRRPPTRCTPCSSAATTCSSPTRWSTVTLGGQKIKPEKVEAGTGFYEEKFVRGEVKPEMGKRDGQEDRTPAWPGAASTGSTWRTCRKVTPHEGTPLKLEKTVFKKTLTKTGPVLEEVKGPVQVGDELVMRVVLRTDRDMEYVHLKDHRGSGTEPVNVLSRYKFQDGLAYYESTKDTATHFFIDYLPKGTYVFEYPVRVQSQGEVPDRAGEHPVHVRPGVQQPLGERDAGGEVKGAATARERLDGQAAPWRSRLLPSIMFSLSHRDPSHPCGPRHDPPPPDRRDGDRPPRPRDPPRRRPVARPRGRRRPRQGQARRPRQRRRGVPLRGDAAAAGEDPREAPRLQLHRPVRHRPEGRHHQPERHRQHPRPGEAQDRRPDGHLHSASGPCRTSR